MGNRSFLELKSLSFLILFLISLPSQVLIQGFGTTVENEEAAKQLGKEKLSHFQFYWHDVVTGPNPTSVRVVNPVPSSSPTEFGLVNMIDNPLTEGPNQTSKLVGRAQGFYASACQKELGLLMSMNLAFMEGKYKGSTLTVLGRNMVFTKVREMAIIGGSGLFRFARGYVQARTHTLHKTGDAIVHYDCYVLHY